ncbi:DUF1697 domain-containing protein [Granulicella sp. S190]|uniref:DUF1697 domain-containing protein n=1 Tax=Granulicella sp. S190 TaxID=1747226 RepID=UPI00131CCFFF|nr:DUF1697 domain-containing protein [Granulicella sp. S190]
MKERGAKAVSRHVALLRGINVGGKNMLPMKELAGLFGAAGCEEVTTYIQSGNVIFSANDRVVQRLEEEIAKQISNRFGLKVPVVIRSAAELEEAVRGNPFFKAGVAEELLHVAFLADRPAANLVAGLDVARSSPDEFAVMGREIYMKLVTGAAHTKLTNAYFDSKLKTVSTMRNWRTVLKLAEMMR